MEVRRFISTDANLLADLLNRNHYWAAAHGGSLDGSQVLKIFAERVVDRVYVGVSEGGQIHGCLAFARGSGRRECGPMERFAGLYVIDEKYRNSMLAGKLFNDAFLDIVLNTDIRTLRIEVNPTNRKALPIYLRIGFRSYPGARADEDGYVEMVSHLPGVISDIRKANPRLLAETFAPKLSMRMMLSGRATRTDSGVISVEGRPCIRYPIDTGDMKFIADMDIQTGCLLARTVEKNESSIEWPIPHGPVLQSVPVELAKKEMTDGILATISSDGTFRLRQGDEPILLERWPVLTGVNPPTVRRSGGLKHIQVKEIGDVWEIVELDSQISRTIRFLRSDNNLESLVVETHGHDASVVVTPWCAMRICEHALRIADEWIGSPVFLGTWPPTWTDYEAAFCDPKTAVASASAWCSANVGLVVTWSGAQPRFEARALPQLIGGREGEPVTYRIDFVKPHMCRPQVPASGFSLVETQLPHRRPGRVAMREAIKQFGDEDREWRRTEIKEKLFTLTCDQQEVRIAENTGITEWSINQASILSAPFPAHITQGSLAARRFGLWCAGIAKRTDEDQGVEWVEDAEGLPFSEKTGTPGTWSVRPSDDCQLQVSATLPQASRDQDVAIMLVPKTDPRPSLIVRLNGWMWQVNSTSEDWRGSVDSVIIPFPDGQHLLVSPVGQLGNPEVFLRQTSGSPLISLLTDGSSPSPSMWHLTLAPSRRAAIELSKKYGRGSCKM